MSISSSSDPQQSQSRLVLPSKRFDPHRYQQASWKGKSLNRETGKPNEYHLTIDTHEWRVVECTCGDYYYRVLRGYKAACPHQGVFNTDEEPQRRERLQQLLWLEEELQWLAEHKRQERARQVELGHCNVCHRESIAAVCDDCLYR